MKRTSLGITGLFLALLSIITCISSCEVEHTYDAEVTVVDEAGYPVSGVTVISTVDVNADHEVGRNGTTDAAGKVSFSYDNLAILQVDVSRVSHGHEYSGEGLLVLEEDELVKITVVIYGN